MIVGPRLTPVLILFVGFSLMMFLGDPKEVTFGKAEEPPPSAAPATEVIDCREVAQQLWNLTGVVGSRDKARIKTTEGKRVVTNSRKSRAITQFTRMCTLMTQKERACILDASHQDDLMDCGFGPPRR